MKLKLINTREAGDILGVSHWRIRYFIEQGLLKDYWPKNSKHKRHYNKLSVTEVREFKKKYHIDNRTIRPKVGSNNGQPQKEIVQRGRLISTVQNSSSDESITVTVPLSEPIKAQLSDRLVSIEERLTAIENRIVDTLERKLNDIIKLWA